MRLALLLFVLPATAASGQTLDPNPPSSYYPLDVGNEWVYVERFSTAVREVVVGDSVVDGNRFSVIERSVIGSYDSEIAGDTTLYLVRVADDDGAVVYLGSQGEEVSDECSLALPLPVAGEMDIECGSEEAVLFGGVDQYVEPGLLFGGGSIQATLKGFRLGDGSQVEYAVAIGPTYRFMPSLSYRQEHLVYARTASGEFGMIPVPDAADPSDYYPLQVGNEWEYLRTEYPRAVRKRRVVTRDTMIAGVRYLEEAFYNAAASLYGSISEWGEPSTRWVRRDESTGHVLEWVSDSETRPVTCPFASPFNQVVGCARWSQGSGGPAGVVLGYAVNGSIRVGDDDAPFTSFKEFVDLSAGFADSGRPGGFGAGIGPLPQTDFAFCEPVLCNESMTYLRLVDADGTIREYGRRYGVSSEDAPATESLTLAAFPTPTAGPLAVEITGMRGPTTVEVFDALGRQVWHAEPIRQGAEVDAGAWAPGLYVVRARSGGETATQLITVAR